MIIGSHFIDFGDLKMRRLLLGLSLLVSAGHLVGCFDLANISIVLRSVFRCHSRVHVPKRRFKVIESSARADRRRLLVDLLSNAFLVQKNYDRGCLLAYDEKVIASLRERCDTLPRLVESKLSQFLSRDFFVCTWAEFARQQVAGVINFTALMAVFNAEWGYYQNILPVCGWKVFESLPETDCIKISVDTILQHEDEFFRALKP
jgi:hypothetical protein